MEPGAHEDEFNGMDESLNCGDANSTETQTIGDDLFTEESQQRAAAIWILKAREQHRFPLSVMDAMIGDFQSLHQVAMTSCRQRVETTPTYSRRLNLLKLCLLKDCTILGLCTAAKWRLTGKCNR